MRRFFLSFFIFTLFLVYTLFPRVVHAEGEFITDSKVTYKVEESGNVHVTHFITLENAFPTLYAKSYSLELVNINPKNLSASEDGHTLAVSVQKNGTNFIITANFDDALVGKGAKRNFEIFFDVDSFTEKNGEVWEVAIPKLTSPDSFRDYSVIIEVPKSFGDLSYITPDPNTRNIDGNSETYTFTKDSISASGVKAGFGEFQVFSYVLSYHLENPLSATSETKIAIPPDTAFQKIYLESINPKPKSIDIDEDGNWIATYLLKERERIDVMVKGTVQMFASPRDFLALDSSELEKDIMPQKYWEADNLEIKSLAKKYSNTRDIYDYVTSLLSYNYDRVKPNVQRMGALAILSAPDQAICMEYTDLFIAISRAAGIPAREINGYAYSDNPEIKPLSLVSDVLHSWPEYWNSSKKVWVPVDPTWQDTTGGADFFNKLDLRHFTFVIHGADSQMPYPPGSYKLGVNPQKDVFVNFGRLPDENVGGSVSISAKVTTIVPLIFYKVNVTIQNTGLTAIYNEPLSIFFDNKTAYTSTINYLLPDTQKSSEVSIPFSILGLKTPQSISASFAGQSTNLPGTKSVIIITNAIAIFLLVIVIFVVAIIRSKRIHFSFINNFVAKIANKFKHDNDEPNSDKQNKESYP